MKSLYIIGAGGAAKEIYLLIKQINNVKQTYDFKGFIDISKKEHLQIGSKQYNIINETEFLTDCETQTAIVFGLADTHKMKKIVELYQQNKFFYFPTLVHPSVKIDESIHLDEGNIITSDCVFTVDTSISSFNYINRGVHIGHDCVIGSFNVINPCAVISGGVVIENENLVGANATILQYLKIGSNNQIGAGAVVTKDIGDNKCMVGIPAKNL